MKIIHELINLGKGIYGDGHTQIDSDDLLKIYDERDSSGGGTTGSTVTTNGHIILDGSGNTMTQQPNLRFNRMLVTNNNVNQQTIVTRPGSIILSETPPLNPLIGDEWVNSTTWKTYVYYDNYWVEKFRVGNGNQIFKPILNSYINQSAMIADQVNQISNYIYYDGTSYYEYLGTTNGDITDYRRISFNIYGTATNGNVLTIVAGVPTWQAPASGSKWTDTTGGIYRDSRVLVGGTTFTDSTAKLEVVGRVSQVGIGDNTYFGYRAGQNNTIGIRNSFFGYDVGLNNTTGNENSFFGLEAGLNNTTGNENSFFGVSAGLSNTTGGRNSFFGVSAGLSNTTGVQNSFFGNGAGQNNTTGYSNTFFGLQAGRNNTTGNENSFFGLFAGLNNTTGGQNSFFGRNAGRYIANGSNLFITNNSVFLGFETRANADNETNQTVIGYQAIGLGSNTTVIGNASTTFGRWWGRLLLGTSTDSGDALRVNGTVRLDSVTNATGDVVTIDANNVLRRQTVAQILASGGEITLESVVNNGNVSTLVIKHPDGIDPEDSATVGQLEAITLNSLAENNNQISYTLVHLPAVNNNESTTLGQVNDLIINSFSGLTSGIYKEEFIYSGSTIFILESTPTIDSLDVFIQGQLQSKTGAYNLIDNELTIINSLEIGDRIICNYSTGDQFLVLKEQVKIKNNTIINFNFNSNHGFNTISPLSGTITFDFTNAVVGNTVLLRYKSLTNPTTTFPSYVKIIAGFYDIFRTNYISFYLAGNLVGNEIVLCTISQNTNLNDLT
jgi:hypothetical protein